MFWIPGFQLAKVMNDSAHYEDLMKRSKNFVNVFDPSVNFMRGKLENGDWISPFNPQYPYYEYMYREANAWQVSFYAPHDMPGLVELYGGKEKFEQKLDSLFTHPWNPRHIVRNVSGFIGQYCHGNQPDHEALFAYYFAGKPWKSRQVIDNILTIKKRGKGRKLAGITVNGRSQKGYFVPHDLFSSGGILEVRTQTD